MKKRETKMTKPLVLITAPTVSNQLLKHGET